MKILTTFLFALLLAPLSVPAAPITTLYVFGDSLSDQGNGWLLTGGAFPPDPYAQRASNGPVAAERLADRLGVALAPSAAGGTNYAVVGATTGPVTVPGTSMVTDNFAALQYGQPQLDGTGIINQVLAFLASGTPVDSARTLFMVWGGPNDFFLDPSADAAADAVANLAGSIQALYGAGGRRFLVPNMPDLSLTPSGLALPLPARAGLQALSLGFNLGLENALSALDGLPGADISRFDTFGLLTGIAVAPGAYGFGNAVEPCLTGDLSGGGVICPDPDTYVFWDSAHPTSAAHTVLGDGFAQAVPEPAAMALVAFGLVASLVRARRASANRR